MVAEQTPTRSSKGRGKQAQGDKKIPRSAEVALRGVYTGQEFAALMSALMTDVLSGTIDPATANAACNAGARLLKVVEMQYRYGNQPNALRSLPLAPKDTSAKFLEVEA